VNKYKSCSVWLKLATAMYGIELPVPQYFF